MSADTLEKHFCAECERARDWAELKPKGATRFGMALVCRDEAECMKARTCVVCERPKPVNGEYRQSTSLIPGWCADCVQDLTRTKTYKNALRVAGDQLLENGKWAVARRAYLHSIRDNPGESTNQKQMRVAQLTQAYYATLERGEDE